MMNNMDHFIELKWKGREAFVIITVCKGRNQADWFDIELSPETKALDLLGLLQHDSAYQSLIDEESIIYNLEGRLPEGPWFHIPHEHKIGDSGLMEGSFVRIQRTYGTTDERI
ncbi:hypothetical protein [Paenibacillus sp. YPG26]|uniref:hypothetical protein n=1 Tax=Paenibacillus sp. YPG26 TaxID=2878915 RepID=UPI002040BBE1|nr:hypothetical protein [Paenibacillus sp. YPG26]USB31989.1 hypothetical protein LDO05_11615 [Paenibacillus sp. YPG26]